MTSAAASTNRIITPDQLFNAFGLAEDPFKITPDVDYFYPRSQHLEIVQQLQFGLLGGALTQLSGEVGLGKTLICRKLLSQLDGVEGIKTAYLFNPPQNFGYLLASIIHDLSGVRPARDPKHHHQLVELLYRLLLVEAEQGNQVLLIIDEAHRLSPEVLEGVRLLTNLETGKRKLLSILLVGQPELEETLARKDLRQLSQRVAVRCRLRPLSREQTAEYVHHRLSREQGRVCIEFNGWAHWWLYRASAGIPRRINLLAGRAMLAAFAQFAPVVGAAHVRSAIKDLAGRGW